MISLGDVLVALFLSAYVVLLVWIIVTSLQVTKDRRNEHKH